MFVRLPAASLGCSGCRKLIIRAVALRQGSHRITSQANTRFFSSDQKHTNSPPATQAPRTPEAIHSHGDSDQTYRSNTNKPWFLEVEAPTQTLNLHTPTLPKPPAGAPAFIQPMIKYIFEDMGLDDISLMDLRDLDPPAALGPNLIMLFATARSERHLHVAAGRFVRWLRRNCKVDARADGLIGAGELKTKLRRLRKKAKLMGTNTTILPGSDSGISTGWVCVNFRASDTVADEAAHFDEDGRFSGFGGALTGTTVVIQCMTELRRNELDLEALWQGVLRSNLERTRKIKGLNPKDCGNLESLVASKLQLPKTDSAIQWQKMQQESQRQRYYSTLTRSPPSGEDFTLPSPETSIEHNVDPKANMYELAELQQNITNMQISGTTMSPEVLERLIQAVFEAPCSEDDSSTRLQIIDRLLSTASERGMLVQSKAILVTLIEAILGSPAYGVKLKRAQKNLEYLLVQQQEPLEHSQTLRLMTVYAMRQSWDRFWDTFHSPVRYRLGRPAEAYELVYKVFASTQHSGMCSEVLRWVYPEMQRETPPVILTGPVYRALKACILIADPAAEELLYNPPPPDTLDTIGLRRLKRREFLNMLKDVEESNQKFVGKQAIESRKGFINQLNDPSSLK